MLSIVFTMTTVLRTRMTHRRTTVNTGYVKRGTEMKRDFLEKQKKALTIRKERSPG